MKPPNNALQRTWPSFSSSIVVVISGGGFGEAVLLPEVGHAAERECVSHMLIEQLAPEVVGGRAGLSDALRAGGARACLERQTIDKLLDDLPPALLGASCFLDKITGLWRYEFDLPYTVGDQLLWGTHMWLPVRNLFDVLLSARERLSEEERARYLSRLATPEKHEATLVEFVPVLRLPSDVAVDAEFRTGVGNRDVDWRIRNPNGPPVLIDVKKRSRDLLEMVERLAQGERDPDGTAPAPAHDASILFRSIEQKLQTNAPECQLQGAWIVTDVKQENEEIVNAFEALDPQKVHFAVLGGWKPGVAVLSQREEDAAILMALFREQPSNRHFFTPAKSG